MSEHKLLESFRWFRDDVKTTSTIGKKTRIKGRAIFPTVSGNKRKYLEQELIRAGRTLAGNPIDVNHEYDLWLSAKEASEKMGKTFEAKPPKFKGNVLDADYEDGYVEYVAEINDPIYAEKMRDREKLTKEQYIKKWGIEPIRGVSISAEYRYAEEAGVKGETIPRGLFFKRLSLVEPPEVPGVTGTTINVMEALHERSLEEAKAISLVIQGVAPNLLETYNRDVIEPMEKEVKRVAIRQDNPQDTIIFDSPPNTGKVEESTNRIGEPFAGFADWAECEQKIRAANPDYSDEQVKATCGKLKAEHETQLANEAAYPWEQCISDRLAAGYSQDSADKICAAIKNGTVHNVKEEIEKMFGAPPKKVDELDKVLDSVANTAKQIESAKESELKKAKEDAVLEALRCASNKIKQLSDRDVELDKKLDNKVIGVNEVLKKLEETSKLLKSEVDDKASNKDVEVISETLIPIGNSLDMAAKLIVEQRDKLKSLEAKLVEDFNGIRKQLTDAEAKIDGKLKESFDSSVRKVEELKTKLVETQVESATRIKELNDYNIKLKEESDKIKLDNNNKLQETEQKFKTLNDYNIKLKEESDKIKLDSDNRIKETDEKFKALNDYNIKLKEESGKQVEEFKTKLTETESKSATQTKELIDSQNKVIEDMKLKLTESEKKLQETNDNHNKQLDEITKQINSIKEESGKTIKELTETVKGLRRVIKPEFRANEKIEETKKPETYPNPPPPV